MSKPTVEMCLILQKKKPISNPTVARLSNLTVESMFTPIVECMSNSTLESMLDPTVESISNPTVKKYVYSYSESVLQ